MPSVLEISPAPAESADRPRRHNLKRLFSPRHVAFIGGREAEIAMQQCLGIGFTGDIWPVNPGRESMAGQRCFASVADLPAAPDAAFIAVPREDTVEVVRELAARGAGGCVCYAAGFAEVGEAGAAVQAALVAAAGDMPLVGPNCYGLLNYLDGAALWPDQHGGKVVERGVAIITQSGNIGLNLTMQDRSLPLAYVVSVGNQAALGFADYMEALIEDERVTAIGLHIEGIDDIAAFSRAAARALEKGVPLVVLKAGVSEAGARLTLSHTSSLAGSAALHDALCRRLGIVQAGSLSGLLETLKLLMVVGPLAGRRLALLSCSGGEASLVADQVTARGFTMPLLNPKQTEVLQGLMPAFATVSNPLDYNTSLWGDGPRLERCFATMMDGDVDITLLSLDFPRSDVLGADEQGLALWHVALNAFIAAQKRSGRAAAVMSTLPELLPPAAREQLIANGIAPLQGLEATVAALDDAATYGAARRQILTRDRNEIHLPPPPTAPRSGRVQTLDEAESKRLLAAAGLPVPLGSVVAPADAPEAAAKLGFPVAVKAVGSDFAHKSDIGAVVLNLTGKQAVATAVASLPESSTQILVERMVTGAVAELIVGVTYDPGFGLALVIGSGGVLVELIEDSRSLLLPTGRDEIEAALDSLKASRLLDGYRGRPQGDRAAAVEAILAVAAFAEAHRSRLVELDINPLMVLPRGDGVIIADALIRMTREEEL